MENLKVIVVAKIGLWSKNGKLGSFNWQNLKQVKNGKWKTRSFEKQGKNGKLVVQIWSKFIARKWALKNGNW